MATLAEQWERRGEERGIRKGFLRIVTVFGDMANQ